MGRIRSIKPETPQSESLGRVSRDARLTFLLLFTIADDEGRARGSAQMVRSLLFPYDDDVTSTMVAAWLGELHSERSINCYSINGNSYIAICNWLQHQKIDKPTPSKLPPPPEAFADYSPNPPGTVAEESPTDWMGLDGIGAEGNGDGKDHSSSTDVDGVVDSGEPPSSFELSKATAQKPRGYSAAFESWWLIYPKKAGKQPAASAFGRAVSRIAASRSCPRDKAASWLNSVTRVYADSPTGRELQFVPYPQKWLNEARYDDDQSEWQRVRTLDRTAAGSYGGSGQGRPKTTGQYSSKRYQGDGT